MHKELQDQLISLLSIYVIDEGGMDLVSALQNDWNIFKITDKEKIKVLVIAILNGLEDNYSSILTQNVKISIPSETADLIDNWNLFKKEIKEENRFS